MSSCPAAFEYESSREAEPLTPAPTSGSTFLRARFFSAPHVSPLLSGRSMPPPPRLGAEAGAGFVQGQDGEQSPNDDPKASQADSAHSPKDARDVLRSSGGAHGVETGLGALMRSNSLVGRQAPGHM